MAETTTMLPLTTTTTTTATTATPTSPTTSMDQVHPTRDAQIPLLTTEDTITTEHQTISSMTAANPSITVSSNETTMLTTLTIFRLTTIQGNYHESLKLLPFSRVGYRLRRTVCIGIMAETFQLPS